MKKNFLLLLTFLVVFAVRSQADPSVAMCWGKPWQLSDTTQWTYVYNNLDIQKIYIGNITDTSTNPDSARNFIEVLLKKDIKIAIELGGLLDWHANKVDRAGEASFQQDYNNVKPLINLIKNINPQKNINMLDMDGPIRRMLFPNNIKEDYHTIESAVVELFEVVKWWRDSIPGIEINLLTNFPNWAWGDTPAYLGKGGDINGYGQYREVLAAVKAKSEETGIKLDGITIDNPYNYATGAAQSNQPDVIQGVDWMKRIKELADTVKAMELLVNMIFNTGGGRTAQDYSEQTLALIDLYHQKVGKADGYWIQSWYKLPGAWLPETEDYTMTNLTLKAIEKINQTENKSIAFIPDYRKTGLVLKQNYPNPFASTTRISWYATEGGHTRIDIYDMAGEKINTLINHHMQPGNHALEFNAENLPAGVYFYHLHVGDKRASRKMTVME